MARIFRRKVNRLAQYFRGLEWWVAAAVLAAVCKAIAAAALAYVLKKILDTTIRGGHLENVFYPFAEGITLSALIFLSALTSRGLAIKITQRILKDMRQDIVAKLTSHMPETIGIIGRAKIQSLALYGTDKVEAMVSNSLGVLLPGFITAATLTLVLVWLSPLFGVLTIVGACVLWVFNRAQYKTIGKNIERYTAAVARFNHGLLLTLERLQMTKASAIEWLERNERALEITALQTTAVATEKSATLSMELLGFLGNLALLALLAGGTFVVGDNFALSDLLALYVVLFLIRSQTAGMGSVFADVQFGTKALGHIWKFFDIEDKSPYTGTRVFSFGGDIKFESVDFSYGAAPLLTDINLSICRGKCTVITGVNGSGKTTLLKLVLGLIRPSKGVVTTAGIPFEKLDLTHLREATSFLPQDPMIFDGTILDNIAFGRPEASLREVDCAADKAGVADYIRDTEFGYDTKVGDSGLLLSGGEKQRLALARALIGRPRLLVLDEPTNHIDAESIDKLMAELRNMHDAPAVFIVTHDLKVARHADTLFRLSGGRLEAVPVDREVVHLVQPLKKPG